MKKQKYVHLNKCKGTSVVDIVMLTYNHGRFIRKAIESVLMQHSQFSYKIIIGDDASTDSTQKIIMDYYKRYSDRMELYLWKKNVGANKNLAELLKSCKGKYVAYLEGDDYWTDSLKIEKQINFLEKDSQFIGTVHNVRCVNADGKLLHRDFWLYPISESHIYGKINAERFELASQTASLLHRNIWKNWTEKDLERYFESEGNGDTKINFLLGLSGDVYYFRDIMADHRRVFSGESWTAKSSGQNILWFHYVSQREMQKCIKSQMKIDINVQDPIDYILEESFIQILNKCTRKNIHVFLRLFIEKIKQRRIRLRKKKGNHRAVWHGVNWILPFDNGK